MGQRPSTTIHDARKRSSNTAAPAASRTSSRASQSGCGRKPHIKHFKKASLSSMSCGNGLSSLAKGINLPRKRSVSMETSRREAAEAMYDTARQRGSYTNREGEWVAQQAAIFYTKNLAPSILLNLLMQLVSAAIFMQVEHWDFGVALYHCLITASTVGYAAHTITERRPTRRVLPSHCLSTASNLGRGYPRLLLHSGTLLARHSVISVQALAKK
jgi:hypothetical protein